MIPLKNPGAKGLAPSIGNYIARFRENWRAAIPLDRRSLAVPSDLSAAASERRRKLPSEGGAKSVIRAFPFCVLAHATVDVIIGADIHVVVRALEYVRVGESHADRISKRKMSCHPKGRELPWRMACHPKCERLPFGSLELLDGVR